MCLTRTFKICQNCPTNCISCSAPTVCTTCSAGYAVDSLSKCSTCAVVHGTGCTSCSNIQCNSCFTGYTLNPNLRIFNLYLANNACTNCQTSIHSQCSSCTYSGNLICLSCYVNYARNYSASNYFIIN